MKLSKLASEYGTEKGAAPALAQLAMAALGLGAVVSDQRHTAELTQQAEAMNQVVRELEAKKMEQTINSLGPSKLASIAEEIGTELARSSLGKEAAIGALVGALGRGLGGTLAASGRGLGALGRSGNTFRFQQAARRAGVGVPTPAAGVGTALRQSGVSLQQTGRNLSSGATQAQQNMATQQARRAASKPLIGTGTKLKLLGGATALGAGYAGLKGLQTARDYMMMPAGQSTYGRHGPQLMHNVSQYGYPTY